MNQLAFVPIAGLSSIGTTSSKGGALLAVVHS
jgi:hypothetical protein